MKQGSLVEVAITDLNTSGEGVGRIEGKVIFVPDTVTGDRALVRLTRIKSQYAEGKLEQLLTASGDRIRPRCIVADKCGGCQWQHIDWEHQLKAKRDQVIQSLQRLGDLSSVSVNKTLHTAYSLNYRNKSTYPLGISSTGNVQAGYYRKQSHKLVNLNQCPVQDSRLNPLLKEIKEDIQQQGWPIYNEINHEGCLRHLSLRIGSRTGEILLTLVTTDLELPGIKKQAAIWLDKYPHLVGVCLNLNRDRTNIIFGTETSLIAGQPYITEIFGGLEFQILSDTFFQVNTEAAELLLNTIINSLDLQGKEVLLDAYCGIGTFTLPLAQRVQQAVGIEVQTSSIAQAKHNAQVNNINNISFHADTVENYLQKLELKPDIVLLDPPRKGCNPQVIDSLLQLQPSNIVYISCKPATLARDLKLLCSSGIYQPVLVQPIDFFPQTNHVESLVMLKKQE